jgi:hypothetical protein
VPSSRDTGLVRIGLVALLVLAFATGCGADGGSAPTTAGPATLPASALPDLEPRARALGLEALAADSLKPEPLRELLEESGYVAGNEREFSGKTTTFDHVVARTLLFENQEGADAYLGWLGAHGHDFLGRADRAQLGLPGDSGVGFTLAACGTCKKELPTFLAGWRRGATVLSLLASGSGANPERFGALARELDGTVG